MDQMTEKIEDGFNVLTVCFISASFQPTNQPELRDFGRFGQKLPRTLSAHSFYALNRVCAFLTNFAATGWLIAEQKTPLMNLIVRIYKGISTIEFLT